MVEITSIEQIEKEPYTETIWSREKREERLACVFAFYLVELNINRENTVFEAEVRDVEGAGNRLISHGSSKRRRIPN
jgi:hypothetical protein